MKQSLPHAVSIVMPVRNEAAVIDEVVEEWHRDVLQYAPAGSELLFDDGASTDGTLAKLAALQQKYPCIRVMQSKKDGFVKSATRLYTQARCPLIFFTDSDGQYIAEEFWKLAPHIEHCDLIHGAKMIRRDPFLRVISSDVFNFLARRKFGTKLGDINSAFRLMRKSLVDQVVPLIHCLPNLYNAELLLRAHRMGFHILQVDVAHRPRKFGYSRGLPATGFVGECWRAYRGLCELQAELANTFAPERQGALAP